MNATPVRLAVIDVRMPGMTGPDVLAELRTASPEARAILITAEDDPTHRAAAMNGGAAAFFFKPFDDAAFVEAIRPAIAPPA